MKKTVAILLAVLLCLGMSAVALADSCEADLDYGSCEVDCAVGSVEYEGHMLPGESYKLVATTGANDYYSAMTIVPADVDVTPGDDATYGDKTYDDNVVSEDDSLWRVSADWTIGGALVSKVAYDDDDDAWEITLNENYTISTAKKLYGTITFTNKKDKDNTVDVIINQCVSNHLVTIDGDSSKSDAEDDPIDAEDNTIYQCDEDNPGYVAFNDGRLLTCVLKMVKNEKAFMYNNEDMIDDIDEAYDDTDASIDCYTFGGTPTFTNAAQFTLQADYSDQYYVYTWNGSKLTAVDYDWNSIDGIYEWSTKSPVSYVISDTELVAADEEDEDSSSSSESASTAATASTATDTAAVTNPDTGADDAVGVAVALAAVSLAAAGATCLKK